MPLVTIDSHGHQLNEQAAHAFLALKKDAEAAGFVVVVNSATRDSEKQKALFAGYVKAMAAWMKAGSPADSKPKPVAKPGTSEHEEPRACAVDVDVSDKKLLQWLLLNSTTYGFWLTAANERWHYAHYPDGPPTHLRERHLSNLRTFGSG